MSYPDSNMRIHTMRELRRTKISKSVLRTT